MAQEKVTLLQDGARKSGPYTEWRKKNGPYTVWRKKKWPLYSMAQEKMANLPNPYTELRKKK
jgi:hypothetical protein